MNAANNTTEKGIVQVRVKVTPGASKEVFRQTGAREFEAYVREPAQKNMANRRVLSLVKEHFEKAVHPDTNGAFAATSHGRAEDKGAIGVRARVVTGHRSRSKTIEITV